MRKQKYIEDIYPLSPTQQGVLFHTLYAPDSGVYLEQLSCTLAGELDVPALKSAWAAVIKQQAVLRTGFVWRNRPKPLQVVYSEAPLPWEERDWLSLTAMDQQQSLDEFLRSDRELGFDLSKPPLIRLTLIHKAEGVYQFVWSHHLLLMDGWCQALILDEVFRYYKALSADEELIFEPRGRYRDYVAWLGTRDLVQAENYWRRSLKGFRAPTQFPHDPERKNFGEQGTSWRHQQTHLSTAVTSELELFARRRGLTLAVVIEGAWALLLSRYNGERDVVFGITMSGRPAELTGSDTMVGLFINTLPLRVQVMPEQLLGDWLQQLQQEQLELKNYEYSPLIDVQGWSEVPRGKPLFESILVIENYNLGESLPLKEVGLDIGDLTTIERTSYSLTIKATPGEKLGFTVSYDAAQFEDETISRLLGHLQTLVEAMVANQIGRASCRERGS